MKWDDILAIIFAVLSIVGAFVSYYFYIKNKLTKAAVDKIEEFEKEGIDGLAKKAEVITNLKKIIPAFLKPFITDQMLDALVQALFESIERYAKKQVEKEVRKNDND